MRSISVRTSSMLLQSLALRGAIMHSLAGYHGIGLDLDQPVRIDESRDLEHARRRADIAEELAVHAADHFPMRDIDEIDPRADHVLQRGTRIGKRLGDDLDDGARLRGWIADRHWLAARARGRAADGDDVAHAHGAGEADDRLVGASGRHQHSFRRRVHAALLHQSCGLARGPADASITRPVRNSVSSSNGLPINCSPSGVPSDESPAGTEIPGRPAMFTVTVKMSLRYISRGSPDFSTSAKAGAGVVGVKIASTDANAASKSRLIKVLIFCALR